MKGSNGFQKDTLHCFISTRVLLEFIHVNKQLLTVTTWENEEKEKRGLPQCQEEV